MEENHKISYLDSEIINYNGAQIDESFFYLPQRTKFGNKPFGENGEKVYARKGGG